MDHTYPIETTRLKLIFQGYQSNSRCNSISYGYQSNSRCKSISFVSLTFQQAIICNKKQQLAFLEDEFNVHSTVD